MKDFKAMTEQEKQAHLFERLEKLYENFVAEYDLSRISWIGTLESFKLKMLRDWEILGAFGSEDEDDE